MVSNLPNAEERMVSAVNEVIPEDRRLRIELYHENEDYPTSGIRLFCGDREMGHLIGGNHLPIRDLNVFLQGYAAAFSS